jgi:hypothetical protein
MNIEKHNGIKSFGTAFHAAASLVLATILVSCAPPAKQGKKEGKSDAENSAVFIAPTGDDTNPGNSEKPLKTLKAARAKVRNIIKNGIPGNGVEIRLAPGRYEIDGNLELGLEDSGKKGAPIVWKGPEKGEAVISGGKLITGWKPYKKEIWMAHLENKSKIRQLYVNGVPAKMAEYDKKLTPNGWYGSFKITGGESWAREAGSSHEGLTFNAEDIPDVANPEDLELQQRELWTIQRTDVKTIKKLEDGKKAVILPRACAAIGFHIGWQPINARRKESITLYNALEFLDKPGEFYFDHKKSTVYYMPRKNEDMSEAKTIIPTITRLISIKGENREKHAGNIQFKNLTFAHTEWGMTRLDDDAHAVFIIQSSAITTKFTKSGNWHKTLYTTEDLMPGAMEMNSASNIVVENCVFKDIASTAINIENDVENAVISGNAFHWVGGGGVNVGHPHHVYIGKENDDNNGFGPYNVDNSRDKWNESVEGLVRNVTVSNNLFRHVGWEWWSTSPLALFYGHSIYFLHNDMKDTPYNSFTSGWSWGEFDGIPGKKKHNDIYGKTGGKPSLSVDDIKFNYNKIVNPYTKLHDTGAIYFIGDQAMQKKGETPKYSEVKGNYIVKAFDPKNTKTLRKLVYCDEGTAYVEFKDNVFDGKMAIWSMTRRHASSRDKQFIHNFFTESGFAKKMDSEKNMDPKCVAKENVELPKGAPVSAWPEEVRKIVEKAGLEPKYEKMLEKNDK